ncbi:MAG: 4-hydroxybutyrate CoA-transferase [Gemmatimonas sp.]|nr:4-hydroxybutyrate CoA-transferase [Gemmatimonas sp.]
MTLPSTWSAAAGSPDDVVKHIRSGMHVFVHGSAATPHPLLQALCRRSDLENVTLYHLHTDGPAPWMAPEMTGRFRGVSLFTGPSQREPVNAGRADYVPIFLSDVPGLFTSGIVKLDAAIVQLSTPDRHGRCSLGTAVDAARAAVDSAALVLAEINAQMPRTHGNTAVALNKLTAFTTSDRPLPEHKPGDESPEIARIGELVAELIEDGSTLQMGIGAIPDAVLSRLGNRQHLGVHTEMFSDRLVDLYHSGAITNDLKSFARGRIVTSFVLGSKKVFDFVHDNSAVQFEGCDYTNDTGRIGRNPKVVAINSALQVDLTGQVCADSIGTRIYSGIGGQMDFIRGAARSPGGKPIIALPSTAAKGTVSRIAPVLDEGAGVVTTRGHVHWVVTEFGAVNLHGRSLRERKELLISIAHPDFRAELQRAR